MARVSSSRAAKLYAGLLPGERTRLHARAVRENDVPTIAKLRDTLPASQRSAWEKTGRVIYRLAAHAASRSELLLARAERDLAQLRICGMSALVSSALRSAGEAARHPEEGDIEPEDWQALVVLLAVSNEKTRVELAALRNVVVDIVATEIGGEDPLQAATWAVFDAVETCIASFGAELPVVADAMDASWLVSLQRSVLVVPQEWPESVAHGFRTAICGDGWV
jgi:hypothetical protein